MIYLIGGAPRVGKTSLAKKLLVERSLPFISTDILTHALGRSYPFTRLCDATWFEAPDLFLPFLEQFVRYAIDCLQDYVIEGAAISPTYVAKLLSESPARACFLGTSQISLTEIIQYASFDDWVSSRDVSEQRALPSRIIEFSDRLKLEASRLTIPYFDVGVDRPAAMQAAYDALVK